MRQIEIEANDRVSHHWSGCVDGNVIGVLDQLDVRQQCLKVGQIVIEDRCKHNFAFYHVCFHPSVFRSMLPYMTFGSYVLHIVVVSATNYCRDVGVVETIEQLFMVHIVECS